MTRMSGRVIGSLLGLLLPLTVAAAVPGDLCQKPDCVLIERGGQKVTLADMDARLSQLDAATRADVMTSPERIEQIVESVITAKQLAASFDPSSVEADPVFQAELAAARDQVYARRRMDELRAQTAKVDFEVLAKERFMANRANYQMNTEVTVQHLLVSREGRDRDVALARAQELRDAFKAGRSGGFEGLIKEFSEDPSKAKNNGIFVVKADEEIYDPAFKNAALALSVPQQVSEPVETQFGFHLIQLIERKESRQREFDEVRDEIIAGLKTEAESRATSEFLNSLRAQAFKVDDDLLLSLRARYLPPGIREATLEQLFSAREQAIVPAGPAAAPLAPTPDKPKSGQ